MKANIKSDQSLSKYSKMTPKHVQSIRMLLVNHIRIFSNHPDHWLVNQHLLFMLAFK